ncbi:hypothetical protein TNCV_5100931 [Trichonephila clavipes]|uniref:Uncharacterized protein n=1 Tax=Trichonephila clavipes TaxID=2585209 RepID=A0A8X6RW78_TRICX|nr:hypothetical protein TNCV_5100931 [Trichonephila clavipes]
MPSTSGYNLRPRRGTKVKSRPANEKRTQPGGSREKQQYTPHGEEQRRSSSRNSRSRSGQQQERKGGANSNGSLSLEVLAGEFNYKTEKSGPKKANPFQPNPETKREHAN